MFNNNTIVFYISCKVSLTVMIQNIILKAIIKSNIRNVNVSKLIITSYKRNIENIISRNIYYSEIMTYLLYCKLYYIMFNAILNEQSLHVIGPQVYDDGFCVQSVLVFLFPCHNEHVQTQKHNTHI